MSDHNELPFLRFFYDAAYDAFGPAADDVLDSIKEDWVGMGEALPEGYERSYDGLEEEEDEDDYNEDQAEDLE